MRFEFETYLSVLKELRTLRSGPERWDGCLMDLRLTFGFSIQEPNAQGHKRSDVAITWSDIAISVPAAILALKNKNPVLSR